MKRELVTLITICLLSIGMLKGNTPENIPFTLSGGLIVVEAQVNSAKGNFIIDTGSSDIILNQSTKKNNHTIATLGKGAKIGAHNIKSLSIGDINLKNIKALTADLSAIEEYIGTPLEGIIGTKTFFPNSLHINYEMNLMIISEEIVPEKTILKSNKTNFIMENDVPVIKVKIGDKTLNFILDSGATNHFIDTQIANELDTVFTDVLKTVNITTTFSSENKAGVRYANEMNIGGKPIEEVRMLTMNFDAINEVSKTKIHGLISMKQLSSRIILDLKRRMILFE